MERLCRFKKKDVVNVCDGSCLGRVVDLVLDECSGRILKLIVGEPGLLTGLFCWEQEYRIQARQHSCSGS